MTPTFTVSVKHYLRGFESESVEITLSGVPANIDLAELDAINERAGRVAQALTVQIRTGEQPKATAIAKPLPAPMAVNASVLDDELPGSVAGASQTSAGEVPATPAAPEYDPHADTDELRPETLAKLAKPVGSCWEKDAPHDHVPYCRCDACYDPFADDADNMAAHVEGCLCSKCTEVPIACAVCGVKRDGSLTFVERVDKSHVCVNCWGGIPKKETDQVPVASAAGACIAPSPAGEVLDQGTEPANLCHRCAEPVFGGGVSIAGETYCHECSREKLKPEAQVIEIDPQDLKGLEPIPDESEIETDVEIFGIKVAVPPIGWANEPITKTGGESDGGQCKALNTVLGAFGYKGGDRHWSTLAIVQQWNQMRVQLDSLDKLTRAEAHLVLDFLDKAKDSEDAQLALHEATQALKGQVPLIRSKAS